MQPYQHLRTTQLTHVMNLRIDAGTKRVECFSKGIL